MAIELLRQLLGWCAVLNMAFLSLWFLLFIFAHDFIYQLHNKWFKLSLERFDSLHYLGMMLFKLAIFFFNIIPYVTLLLM